MEKSEIKGHLEKKLKQFNHAALLAFETGSTVRFHTLQDGTVEASFKTKKDNFNHTYHEKTGANYEAREKPVQ